MSDIQFNDQDYQMSPAQMRSNKPSWLTRLVLSTGLAKDSEGVERVLLILFGIVVLLIVWVNWPSSGGSLADPAEILNQQTQRRLP